MKELYGYMLVALASIIMSPIGILGKLAFAYGIDPVTLIALRLLFSSLTILVPMAFFRRNAFKIEKNLLPSLLVFGVFAVALQRVTYFYAVDFTTATVAIILFYTYPIFVTAYSAMFLGDKVTRSTVLAIALTFSGVALVVKAYQLSLLVANLPGVAFGLLSSVLFALYFLLTKKMRAEYSNWTLMFYGDFIGAAVLFPAVLSSWANVAGYPAELWVIVLAIAWFPSLLAYFLYSYALKHVQPSKGSILSAVEVVSAALLSALVLSESFEVLQIVGVALTIGGVTLLFYKHEQKR